MSDPKPAAVQSLPFFLVPYEVAVRDSKGRWTYSLPTTTDVANPAVCKDMFVYVFRSTSKTGTPLQWLELHADSNGALTPSDLSGSGGVGANVNGATLAITHVILGTSYFFYFIGSNFRLDDSALQDFAQLLDDLDYLRPWTFQAPPEPPAKRAPAPVGSGRARRPLPRRRPHHLPRRSSPRGSRRRRHPAAIPSGKVPEAGEGRVSVRARDGDGSPTRLYTGAASSALPL